MTSSPSVLNSNSIGSVTYSDDRPIATPKTASLAASSNDLQQGPPEGVMETMGETAPNAMSFSVDGNIQKKFSKLLKGKAEEWTAVVQRTGPLNLLDLPMDILKEIVKEVTHTNDLTALALTHSALRNLAIPHIYSRFDIVWPDATSTTDSRTGVDALTFGLSTLTLGNNVSKLNCQHHVVTCSTCGSRNMVPTANGRRSRLEKNFPQYTRKFSLGNGPADWVQEYMITKESGKMLGTLVALAVGQMVNLETFIWDMPTGVLRDVWLALSSLEEKSLPGECRLERVLVRWHDNSAVEPGQESLPPNSNPLPYNPPGSTLTEVGLLLPPGYAAQPQTQSAMADQSLSNRVEFPTLSVLPPLKSLSVLDIDELAYLDEMSVAIERSKDKLRELRVGISRKAQNKKFVYAWDGPQLQQVDHSAKWLGVPNAIGEMRLGGVLGILLGRVYDIRKKSKLAPRSKPDISNSMGEPAAHSSTTLSGPNLAQEGVIAAGDGAAGSVESNGPFAFTPAHLNSFTMSSSPEPPSIDTGVENVLGAFHDGDDEESFPPILPVSESLSPQHLHHLTSVFAQPRLPEMPPKTNPPARLPSKERDQLDGKLKLQVLELERVPLSICVLQKAFDWSMLTSLTILDCAYHESLWRMLRRQFRPHMPSGSALATSSFIRHSISTNSTVKSITSIPMEYQLNLKKIHTDFATPALIAFLKETLAPNTLEVLFLQDRRKNSVSTVSINDIYRGPLRRHRRSLKKLLIDSSDKIPRGPAHQNDSTRWRIWMLSHEVLAYIMSGNMTSLRELSVAIDFKDWRYFIRRLPQVPTLRSLNIPFIADHVTTNYDPGELANSVVDVIIFNPEIELCYLGISNKCFEILENRPDETSNVASYSVNGDPNNHISDDDDDDDEDEEEEGDDDGEESEGDPDDEEEDIEEDNGTATEAVEASGIEYELSDGGDDEIQSSDGFDHRESKDALRLREILFYDDKVAIFKARHMRL